MAASQTLVVVGQLTRKALNMDNGLATSSVDAARVEAGIAYLAGNYCRAHGVHALLECHKPAIRTAATAAVIRTPRIVLGLGRHPAAEQSDTNS